MSNLHAGIIASFAALLLSINLACAAPAITLSRSSGPPTTKITVSGTGFGTNALVDIYFDLTDLCLADASSAGDISCTIDIPSDAQPLGHWISAVERSSGMGAQKRFVVRTDWPQPRGRDAAHTGFNPFENTINRSNANQLDILWSAPTGETETCNTPVVARGKVYVVARKLYAFNASTGTAAAGFPKVLDGIGRAPAAVANGNVYVGGTFLYAFNAATGAAVAGFPISSVAGFHSLTFYKGNVYVTARVAGESKIYAYDARTGAPVPGFPVMVGTPSITEVSAANGRIYVGSYDAKIHAFDAATGTSVVGYPREASGSFLSAGAIAKGNVFFASSPPTTTVTVKGSGFDASAAVDIYFDTTDLCLAIANAAGTIRCSIKVPKDAQPQTHWISAIQRNSGLGPQKPFKVHTDWGQFHGQDARHTGFNRFENTINVSNAADLDVLWHATIGGPLSNTPVVAGGKVYVGSNDGRLYGFHAEKGTPVPGFPKTLGGSAGETTPLIGLGNVYIATNRPSKLHAFNATTGAAIAGFPITVCDRVVAPPTLYNNNIYLPCGDGSIYALDALTGAFLPGFPITVGSGPSVSAANGRIYASSDDGLWPYDATTGELIHVSHPESGNDIGSPAAILNGQVFFGSSSIGFLYGVHAASGASLWSFPAPIGVVLGTPAVAGGRLIAGTQDGKVLGYSINCTMSCTPLWTTAIDASVSLAVSSSPVLANGVVYINSRANLYALNASNGTILWQISLTTLPKASPAVADGLVLISQRDGEFYAFSVDGRRPSSRLPGGELGVKPALSSLKPNLALKAVRN